MKREKKEKSKLQPITVSSSSISISSSSTILSCSGSSSSTSSSSSQASRSNAKRSKSKRKKKRSVATKQGLSTEVLPRPNKDSSSWSLSDQEAAKRVTRSKYTDSELEPVLESLKSLGTEEKEGASLPRQVGAISLSATSPSLSAHFVDKDLEDPPDIKRKRENRFPKKKHTNGSFYALSHDSIVVMINTNSLSDRRKHPEGEIARFLNEVELDNNLPELGNIRLTERCDKLFSRIITDLFLSNETLKENRLNSGYLYEWQYQLHRLCTLQYCFTQIIESDKFKFLYYYDERSKLEEMLSLIKTKRQEFFKLISNYIPELFDSKSISELVQVDDESIAFLQDRYLSFDLSCADLYQQYQQGQIIKKIELERIQNTQCELSQEVQKKLDMASSKETQIALNLLKLGIDSRLYMINKLQKSSLVLSNSMSASVTTSVETRSAYTFSGASSSSFRLFPSLSSSFISSSSSSSLSGSGLSSSSIMSAIADSKDHKETSARHVHSAFSSSDSFSSGSTSHSSSSIQSFFHSSFSDTPVKEDKPIALKSLVAEFKSTTKMMELNSRQGTAKEAVFSSKDKAEFYQKIREFIYEIQETTNLRAYLFKLGSIMSKAEESNKTTSDDINLSYGS